MGGTIGSLHDRVTSPCQSKKWSWYKIEWKEHNEIYKTTKFEAIDVEVNDKTAIVMLKKSTGFVWKKPAGWQISIPNLLKFSNVLAALKSRT